MMQQKQENQVNRFLMKTSQTISKELIHYIFKNQPERTSLQSILNSNDPINKELLQFIPKGMKESFFTIFEKLSEFNLTQLGTYYGSLNHRQYISFSQCIFMYAEKINEDFDNGFIYLRGSNTYVGQIQKGIAHGKGIALFFNEQMQEETKHELKLEFQGRWKEGEIQSGTNVIWRKDEQRKDYVKIVQYKGKFKDFNFHGEGKKKYFTGEEENEEEGGNFRNGSLIDEDKLRMSYFPPDQHHD